jgi:hypothetical protein
MSVLQFVGDVLRKQPLRRHVGHAARVAARIGLAVYVHQRGGGAGGDDRRAFLQVRKGHLDGV